jgi:hypothetical protein
MNSQSHHGWDSVDNPKLPTTGATFSASSTITSIERGIDNPSLAILVGDQISTAVVVDSLDQIPDQQAPVAVGSVSQTTGSDDIIDLTELAGEELSSSVEAQPSDTKQ